MIKVEDKCEFVGNIMDCVEDFLEEKGVSFSETRQLMIDAGCSEEEIEENDVILYGDNYDMLAEAIVGVLKNWNVLEDEDGYSFADNRFFNLRKGDKIKVRGFSGTFVCEEDATWNWNNGESGWEVLTNNGYVSIDNYIKYL